MVQYCFFEKNINEEKNNIGAIFPPQNKVASTGVFRKEGEEKSYISKEKNKVFSNKNVANRLNTFQDVLFFKKKFTIVCFFYSQHAKITKIDKI